MFKRLVVCSMTILISTALILAQGGASHLMGAVTAVKPDTVTIKMQDGKSETVMLEKSTKFMKNDKPAKAADLKVGDSVMINASMDTKMKMYKAQEVMLGAFATKDNKAPEKKK